VLFLSFYAREPDRQCLSSMAGSSVMSSQAAIFGAIDSMAKGDNGDTSPVLYEAVLAELHIQVLRQRGI
jgi:hypothetical protein